MYSRKFKQRTIGVPLGSFEWTTLHPKVQRNISVQFFRASGDPLNLVSILDDVKRGNFCCNLQHISEIELYIFQNVVAMN